MTPEVAKALEWAEELADDWERHDMEPDSNHMRTLIAAAQQVVDAQPVALMHVQGNPKALAEAIAVTRQCVEVLGDPPRWAIDRLLSCAQDVLDANPVAWMDPEYTPGKPYGKYTAPVITQRINGWTPLFATPLLMYSIKIIR